MWACKDLGCALNFYGQIKIRAENEFWPGSRNGHDEMSLFQKCMAKEQRNFMQAYPDGTYTNGRKKDGDLTVYRYTKDRLLVIDQKI